MKKTIIMLLFLACLQRDSTTRKKIRRVGKHHIKIEIQFRKSIYTISLD